MLSYSNNTNATLINSTSLHNHMNESEYGSVSYMDISSPSMVVLDIGDERKFEGKKSEVRLKNILKRSFIFFLVSNNFRRKCSLFFFLFHRPLKTFS